MTDEMYDCQELVCCPRSSGHLTSGQRQVLIVYGTNKTD